ncbi:MAG: hypothetical protein ACK5AZ_22335 [Bryobacteraceae bacterium]
MSPALALAVLAVLAVLPYLRALALPFISDDYLQILLGRQYGSPEGWSALAGDALYRCRATSLILTYWTERLFGLDAFAYNVSSLVLHVVNTWLVFALGAWRLIGWRVAFVAAAFFGIYEGHQEAVIWYSAIPELLVFFFCLLTLLACLRWTARPGAGRWIVAAAAYFLALASKESAVGVLPLLALAAWYEGVPARRWTMALAPLAALSAVYAALIFAARSTHLHLNDGTFSLHAPVLLNWANSYWRLFWIWGLVALALLRVSRAAAGGRALWFGIAWAAVTLLPYSFLTYMSRVPSRHTYLASAGIAMVVAMGLLALYGRAGRGRILAVAVAAVCILHNIGYIWIRKHAQFVERAEPTEALLRFVAEFHGPFYVRCFPYGMNVVVTALQATGARATLLSAREAAERGVHHSFCFDSPSLPALANLDGSVDPKNQPN